MILELLSLCSPFVLLLLFVVGLLSLLWRKLKLAAIVFLLSFIVNYYFRIIPLNVIHGEDNREQFSVMSFNINGIYSSQEKAEKISRLIADEKIDLAFIIEDFGDISIELDTCLSKILKYSTFENDELGHYFYSKYPIDTIYHINVQKARRSRIYSAIISVSGRKIHVCGLHLASNNYNEHKEYFTPERINSPTKVSSYITNILNASEFRCRESDSLLVDLDKYSYPTLILGDFNDVCGSPVINKFDVSGLKDAWWTGGIGYGATIQQPMPYRIDHILYNKELKLLDIEKIDSKGLSDHDALVARFSY